MKVLIVEDDLRIATPIKEDLEHQQLVVDIAMDGEQAWMFCNRDSYDLILLDLMLPKLNGVELCHRLRKMGFAGSIMMLTARGDKHDKIEGLDAGADDYVVKPFDIDELNARVRALLRRGTAAKEPALRCCSLEVDVRQCQVLYKDTLVDLTPTEYRLLVHFLRNPGRTYTKRELIEKLWSFDETPADSVIKAHIKTLRQKLLAAGCTEEVICTVYGFGYKLGLNADKT